MNSRYASTGPALLTDLPHTHHGYGCSRNSRADRRSRDNAGQRRAHIYRHHKVLAYRLHVLRTRQEQSSRVIWEARCRIYRRLERNSPWNFCKKPSPWLWGCYRLLPISFSPESLDFAYSFLRPKGCWRGGSWPEIRIYLSAFTCNIKKEN